MYHVEDEFFVDLGTEVLLSPRGFGYASTVMDVNGDEFIMVYGGVLDGGDAESYASITTEIFDVHSAQVVGFGPSFDTPLTAFANLYLNGVLYLFGGTSVFGESAVALRLRLKDCCVYRCREGKCPFLGLSVCYIYVVVVVVV